ncbi:endonuclease III [soil metagenome]
MELRVKAQIIYQRLIEGYGEPIWQAGQDALDELILTILSANTNDVNSGRAFDQLKTTFNNDWDAIRHAPLEAIKTAIRPAGMYNQKAPHIVAVLERLQHEQGNYNLDHLATMKLDEAFEYLISFPGVGHKTASIVLLFCFNRGAFPVDTHVQRISQRLGISDRRAPPIKIKAIWEELLPPENFYALHINLIRHGRQTCQARAPRCELCALQACCDYYQGQGEWRAP